MPPPSIAPSRPPVATYPLSALQEGMLFRHTLDTARAYDVEQAIFTLDSGVDAIRLHEAWNTAAARHAALRTTFRWIGCERPLQDVAGTETVPQLRVEVFYEAHGAERRKTIAAFARSERERAFDLAAGPLHRLLLLRFDGASTLIWTNHHAVLDGRSRELVLRDMLSVYSDLPLPDAGLPFAARLAALERTDVAASKSFWRARLAGYDTIPELPQRATPSATQAEAFGSVSRLLDAPASSRITMAARTRRIAFSSLVHAAWATVLGAYSGKRDVVFGAVRAARNRDGSDARTVGLCINTLPMRVAIEPSTPLDTWLTELRDQWNALRPVEHTPLPSIRAWSDLPAGVPLFESAVTVDRERFADAVRDLPGAWVLGVQEAAMTHQSSVPLLLSVAGRERVELVLSYDATRFDAATMTRMLEHVERALLSIATLDGGLVGDLSLAAPGERQRIIRAFNSSTDYPRDSTIPELFAFQVARAPHAIAVQIGAETLTYGQLEVRSNLIASRLRARGAHSGAFIGLCLERSFDMLAALLGIIKTGATSVALDATDPAARIAAIVTDAGLHSIVTSDAFASVFADLDMPVYTVADLGAPAAAGLPLVNECRPLSGAHVMYTSGSTGMPKGAIIPHRAVVRTVMKTSYLRTGSDETLFAFAPLTFDVAILEIWGALLNGARLVLAPPQLPSLDELAAAIETGGVTTLWLTTALFDQIAHAHAHRLRGVRQLIVGGDVMPPEAARRVLAAVPGLCLLNVCGPTEATVLIVAHHVTAPVSGPIPLGRPIANAPVYILDAARMPVPIGLPGELYTGGDGIALGYLNRPALTAERFLPDPFSSEPGASMYRTGDLGRWNADGTITFLGRADSQVKVRGVRVEPAGVDAVLARDPSVGQSVTVAYEESGAKRLASYIVAAPDAQPERAGLERLLKEQLPPAMRPHAIVFLPAMPLTATGKIDRGALPPIASREPVQLERPEGAMEQTIAAHMAETLGVHDPGRQQDFFDLGGDSLLAMRLVAQLRETLGVDLSVRALIDAPTIAGIAATVAGLERRPAQHDGIAVRTLRAGGMQVPLFYVHGDLAGGGRYCDSLAHILDPERPVYVIDAGEAGGTDGYRTIEAIARAAVRALQEIEPHGPYALGGFCGGGLVAYEMARLLERSGESIENLVLLDAFAANAGTTPLAALRARVRVWRDSLLAEPLHAATPDGPSWEAWNAAQLTRWDRLIARYIPGRYYGSLTVLWSDESRSTWGRLTDQWQSVAPHITAGFIPGSHLSTIAGRFADTARVVASYLDQRRNAR